MNGERKRTKETHKESDRNVRESQIDEWRERQRERYCLMDAVYITLMEA